MLIDEHACILSSQFVSTMWPIYIALFILLVYILDELWIDKRLLELSNKFNGPRRWPLVGNALSLLWVGPKSKNFINFI